MDITRKRPAIIILFICQFLLLHGISHASSDSNLAIGFRLGSNLTDPTTNTFNQYEMYLNHPVPLGYQISDTASVSTTIDTTAGILQNEDKRYSVRSSEEQALGFIASVGPGVALNMFRDALTLDGGVRGALLTKYDFKYRNFGGPFQFVLHSGLNYRPVEKMGLAYRFQHMSNAGIFDKNPGLNLHMVEMTYTF